jgi:hypothetical protein
MVIFSESSQPKSQNESFCDSDGYWNGKLNACDRKRSDGSKASFADVLSKKRDSGYMQSSFVLFERLIPLMVCLRFHPEFDSYLF